MICPSCKTFHPGFPGRNCPVCSLPLESESQKNLDRLVLGKMKDYIQSWKKKGKISKETYTEINLAIDAETTAPLPEPITKAEEQNLLGLLLASFFEWIQSFFSGLSGIIDPFWREKGFPQKRNLRKESVSGDDLSEAGEFAGVSVFAELDRSNSLLWAGIRPLLNEYIWWFIGSLLVLAGSIMGIREAWMTLSGLSRLGLVLFALFIYQVLFSGLGLFLQRKSIMTGRILSGISLLLFPVTFSLCSDIVSQNLSFGFISLFLLGLASFGLLKVISPQFNLSGTTFSLTILPSMFILALVPYATQKGLANYLIFLPILFFSLQSEWIYRQKQIQQKGLLLLPFYANISILLVFFNLSKELIFTGNNLLLPAVFLLWILAFSYALAHAFYRHSKPSAYPFIYSVFEIIFLAIVLSIGSGSLIFLYILPVPFNTVFERLIYFLHPTLATLIFLHTTARHTRAIHPFMLLSIFTSYLLGKEFAPQNFWPFVSAAFIPMLGIVFYRHVKDSLQTSLAFWGGLSGIFLFAILQFSPILPYLISPLLIYGILFFGFNHYAGYKQNSFFHFIAGLGGFAILQAFSALYPTQNLAFRIALLSGLLAISYSLFGLGFDKLLKWGSKEDDFKPFDDVALVSIFFSLSFLSFNRESSNLANLFLLLTGAFTILRSFRDKTRVVSFAGFLILALTFWNLLFSKYYISNIPNTALVSSAFCFLSGLLAGLIPIFPDAEIKNSRARRVLKTFRFPFYANNTLLLRDGLSSVSLVFLFYSLSQIVPWFSLADYPDRNLLILSGVLLSLNMLSVFILPGYSFLNLKGSVLGLIGIFVFVGLTAVINRIGRPLPPAIVGRNLSVIIVLLYLFSVFLKRKGEFIGSLLGKPVHGLYYKFVPLYSMLLLGIVLILDAFLVGLPGTIRFLYITPPSFFFGAFLAFFLYSCFLKRTISLHISLFLLIPVFALSFSQHTFIGQDLIALEPPGGKWLPSGHRVLVNTDWLLSNLYLPSGWDEALVIRKAAKGIAFSGLFFAILAILIPYGILQRLYRSIFQEESPFSNLQAGFSSWSFLTTFLLFFIAFSYAFISPGLILLLSGLVLMSSIETKHAGIVMFGLSGILILEGISHTGNLYPFWSGPLHAFIALSITLSLKPLSLILKKQTGNLKEKAHFLSLLYLGIAFIYAFATNYPSFNNNAVPGLLNGMLNGLAGNWLFHFSPGITFFLSSALFFSIALQWEKSLSLIFSFTGSILFTFSLLSAFPASCPYYFCKPNNAVLDLFPQAMLPFFALLSSATALASYYSFRQMQVYKDDFSKGLFYSSDTQIILTAIFLAFHIKQPINNLVYSNYSGLLAITFVVITSFFASFSEKKARHLYFLQTAIGGLYLGLKPAFPTVLTSEVDSIVALLFGFILV
ncbi:MAG: hypothetical protein KDK45_02205 [Leptospiraceae bacterium]|nr:hypothetical protein [Leptospiraceae bacterium]